MEDDRKKKKNKKKKNKQNKSPVDETNSAAATSQVEKEELKINEDFDNRLSRGIEDLSNVDQSHASVHDNQNNVSKTTQFENEVPKGDEEMDLGNQLSKSGDGRTLEETVETLPKENDSITEDKVALEETSLGLKNEHASISKEASLEETNIELQKKNSSHIQEEASVEDPNMGLHTDNVVHSQKKEGMDEKFRRLQDENEMHLQRKTSLESKLLQLEKEKDSWLLKQDGLYEKIKELEEENEIHLHKEAALEWKVLQLEKEIDDGIYKQAHLEENLSHLVEKTDSLISKESSLEEKVKQLEMERNLWHEKENSSKEAAANLDGNFSVLQKQVVELEGSKNYLLRENQRLVDTISGLQFQIQNLEERVASAVSLIETRKVNDQYIKHDHEDIVNNDSQGAASESIVENSEQFGNTDSASKFRDTTSAYSDQIDISKDIPIQDEAEKGTSPNIKSLSETSENASLPVKTIETFEDIAIQSEGEDQKIIRPNGNIVISDSSFTNGVDEIVQVPMDEKHVMGQPSQPLLYEEKSEVPLTDSPLIGAPFRIVSFFARYVSGADLVNKS